MYQFSLEYFSALFLDCIRRSEKSAELEQRLANIMKFASYNIFNNVARGIYGEHKITYSFMITTSIMRNAEVISSEP
jgi:dynein heavy chain